MLTTLPSTEPNLRAYPDGHLQPWEKKTVFFWVMMMTMQLNRTERISILALAKPTSPPPPSTTLSSPCFACLSCPVALPLSESVQVQVGSGQWFRSRPRRRIALRPLLPPGSSTTTAPLVTWKLTSPLQLLPPGPHPHQSHLSRSLSSSSPPSPPCSKSVKDPFFPCSYY